MSKDKGTFEQDVQITREKWKSKSAGVVSLMLRSFYLIKENQAALQKTEFANKTRQKKAH